jgi:hypothetical protein
MRDENCDHLFVPPDNYSPEPGAKNVRPDADA